MAKKIVGTVSSDRMNKTLVVTVTKKVKHPRFKKYVSRFTKYYVHDEHNAAKIGDTVTITPIRPLSKLKRWCLLPNNK